MGVIRGILLVLVSVTLFLSLFATALFWTLSSSLLYENVEKESVVVLKDLLESAGMTGSISAVIPTMQLYCGNNTDSDYVFNEAGYTMSVPCSSVSLGEDAVMDEMIKSLVQVIYYTRYDNCNFWDCGGESGAPLFLVSEKAHNYWNNKFYLLVGVSLILSALVFLLVKKKTNAPILAGSLLIISSIPFFKLDLLFGLFSDKMISKLLNVFFSQSFNISLNLLVWGIILILIGVVFKIFKIGFSISDFLSKFQKKEVKEKVIIQKEKPKQETAVSKKVKGKYK